MRSIEEIINDLCIIGETFKDESGATPTCIPDAVEILMALKTLKEALK